MFLSWQPRCLARLPEQRLVLDGWLREQYLRNFRVQKLLTSVLGWGAVAGAFRTVHLLAVGSAPFPVALVVMSVAAAELWLCRPSDPTRLAEAAWREMQSGNERAALALLCRGADLDFKKLGNQSLFEYARSRGYHEIVEYLNDIEVDQSDQLKKRVDLPAEEKPVQSQTLQELQEALYKPKTLKEVKSILSFRQKETALNDPLEKTKYSPLMAHLIKAQERAPGEHAEIVQALYQAGARPQIGDLLKLKKEGKSPGEIMACLGKIMERNQ